MSIYVPKECVKYFWCHIPLNITFEFNQYNIDTSIWIGLIKLKLELFLSTASHSMVTNII